jgi:hypothetical protein
MKTIVSAILLSVSVSAFAGQSLPDSIKCKSNALSSAVQSFEITEITSFEPDSSIPDASLLNLSVDAGTFEVSFSNECDNGYTVSLQIDDLRALKAKSVKSIKGELNYSDVELSEARNSEEAEEEKVEIICTLK